MSQDEQVKKPLHSFSLAQFKNSIDGMINISEEISPFDYLGRFKRTNLRDYTKEEIEQIIKTGEPIALQQLSKHFFNTNGIYRRILVYYATILQYMGLVIPHQVKPNQKVSEKEINDVYVKAINFIEESNVPSLCSEIALKTLVNGTYYGIINDNYQNGISIITLPFEYCRSRFRNVYGLPMIEFDLNYFNNFITDVYREKAFASFPKDIQRAYKRYIKGKEPTHWYLIPADEGVCFKFFSNSSYGGGIAPFFINLISPVIDYEDYREIEKSRDEDELKKIMIHKIPHLQDGELLFEPEEAEVMHRGIVSMLRKNKNVDVLTTYGDVELEGLADARQTINNNLEKVEQAIFAEGGLSKELFSATGNLTLDKSLRNDLSFMMVLANQISLFLEKVINRRFATSKVFLSYEILPISFYNYEQYITQAFKLATSGYSFLLPALGFGLSQRDLVDIKKLENNVLNLPELLIPLASAYTNSGAGQVRSNGVPLEPGRPALADTDKSDKTLANERAMEGG